MKFPVVCFCLISIIFAASCKKIERSDLTREAIILADKQFEAVPVYSDPELTSVVDSLDDWSITLVGSSNGTSTPLLIKDSVIAYVADTFVISDSVNIEFRHYFDNLIYVSELGAERELLNDPRYRQLKERQWIVRLNQTFDSTFYDPKAGHPLK